MISALDFRSDGLWFEAQSLPSCCFLRQETLPHIVSLHPGVKHRYWRHTAVGNPAMDKYPIQGGVAILSVASCYKNRCSKFFPQSFLSAQQLKGTKKYLFQHLLFLIFIRLS